MKKTNKLMPTKADFISLAGLLQTGIANEVSSQKEAKKLSITAPFRKFAKEYLNDVQIKLAKQNLKAVR